VKPRSDTSTERQYLLLMRLQHQSQLFTSSA
jgi:hypothetical protein